MNATMFVLAIEEDGVIETYITRDMADAEKLVRLKWQETERAKDYGDSEPEDILDVMEDLAGKDVNVVIDSHPLRAVATDLSGIDLDILAQQSADLTRVIAKCDDDAASTMIWVTDSEAESLEGIWNMVQAILEGSIR